MMTKEERAKVVDIQDAMAIYSVKANNKVVAVCETKTTAKRVAGELNVGDHNINTCIVVKVCGNWLTPGLTIHPASFEDRGTEDFNKTSDIELKAAVKLAEDAGLSREVIRTLQG